ncbi:MAG: phosphohydrolase, partial [Pseudomonadota bacterium]
DLLIAGHTHGGQIYIPFVTCALIDFACRVQRYGLNMEERIPVFVTSGTGMTGLPMRFNMPPRIDVLNVATRACDNE